MVIVVNQLAGKVVRQIELTFKLNNMKSIIKKLSFTGIGLCALCCAQSVIGDSIGIAFLSIIAFYLEKFAIGLIIVAGALSI